MSTLLEMQRRVATAVMQPLTRDEGMRQRALDGRSMKAEAEAIIKPNNRLTSFERLEIYNRQYWFRVLSCFGDDFPGLRAVVGLRNFEALSRAYLHDCPSVSFTLRNLGSRLVDWLEQHPKWLGNEPRLALDMTRLEWAHVEAFDGLAEPCLTPADLETGGLELRVALQPYVVLLELAYPAEDLLIEIRQYEGNTDTSSNAARLGQMRRRVRKYAAPEPEPIYLAVHRLEDAVYYKRLPREAFRMLRSLAAHDTLENAIEAAFLDSAMPEDERVPALQEWFGAWSQMGWFCRPSLRRAETAP